MFASVDIWQMKLASYDLAITWRCVDKAVFVRRKSRELGLRMVAEIDNIMT